MRRRVIRLVKAGKLLRGAMPGIDSSSLVWGIVSRHINSVKEIHFSRKRGDERV